MDLTTIDILVYNIHSPANKFNTVLEPFLRDFDLFLYFSIY